MTFHLFRVEDSGERFGYIAETGTAALDMYDRDFQPDMDADIDVTLVADDTLVPVAFPDEVLPPSPMPVGGVVVTSKSGGVKVVVTARAWADWSGKPENLSSTVI